MIDLIVGISCITLHSPHINNEIGRARYISVVTHDPYDVLDHKNTLVEPPYIDPPAGGYSYSKADDYPYYYDNEGYNTPDRYLITHSKNTTEDKIIFSDCPRDYRLKENDSVEFTTCIVDSYINNTIVDCVAWALIYNNRVLKRDIPNVRTVQFLIDNWSNANNKE